MIPKSRNYKRIGKGLYKIVIPVVFTRKDVNKESWRNRKADMLANLVNFHIDIIEDVEKDIRNKK